MRIFDVPGNNLVKPQNQLFGYRHLEGCHGVSRQRGTSIGLHYGPLALHVRVTAVRLVPLRTPAVLFPLPPPTTQFLQYRLFLGQLL